MKSLLDNVKEIENQLEEYDLTEKVEKYSKPILVLIYLVMLIYNGVVVMLGYNWIIPVISNLPEITLFQAILLDFFITFMVTPKFTEDDMKLKSAVYKAVKAILVLGYNTMVLFIMFLLHLCI